MDEVIGIRQRIWHTVLPLTLYVAMYVILIVFRDWIEDYVFGFLGDGTVSTVLYWVFFAGWTVMIFPILHAVDIFFIITMPRNLVTLTYNGINLGKVVKIKDEKVRGDIIQVIESRNPPRWLQPKEIDGDHIWEQWWHGAQELNLDDIKAFAFHADHKNIEKRLQSGRTIRGSLVVLTNDGDVYVQPKLNDLKSVYERLPSR
ncbi:MAG: hypothetical protein FWE16_03405 [Firmicutes bacterium]|nr:hypothetical protein [Bacillota bacterium]